MSASKGMKMFIGTKIILAMPMTLGEYNHYREWTIPDNEDAESLGYLVEYTDGGKPNHPDHEGYISWSPKEVFDNAYQPSGHMNFGHALEMMKLGKKVARSGWNGSGQFVVMMPPLYLPPFSTQEPGPKVNDRTAKFIGEDTPLDCQPYCALFNAQKQWVPGWVPSQGDLFAEDWVVVDGN